MIAIDINGEFLDLPENLTIPYQFNSSLFDFTKLKSSRLFSFLVDRTPKNSRLLKFPQYGKFSELEKVFVFSYGFLIFNAKIKIKTVFEKAFSIELKIGSDFFITDISKTKLTEILPGYIHYFQATEASDNQFLYYPDVNYQFPRLKTDSGDTSNFTPFFFLSFVIKSIFEHYGFHIGENTFETDPNLRKILIVWLESIRRTSNTYLTFANDLPAILLSDFLKEIINITDIALIFEESTNTIHIKSLLTVLSSDNLINAEYYISDFEIYEYEDVYRSLKFKTEYTQISGGEEINSVYKLLDDSAVLDYIYQLSYEIPWYNPIYEIDQIDYTLDILKQRNKLILGFYDASSRGIKDSNGAVSLQVENFVSNHFLHVYKVPRFSYTNAARYSAKCNITFHASFLKELKSGSEITYNEQSYQIISLNGNITGNEYETFNAELIKK